MKWRPVTNDNDILQAGDQFRVWQADQTWSSWGTVVVSADMTLRQFVYLLRWSISHGDEPSRMVEVRRPVMEGDER